MPRFRRTTPPDRRAARLVALARRPEGPTTGSAGRGPDDLARVLATLAPERLAAGVGVPEAADDEHRAAAHRLAAEGAAPAAR